MVASSGETVPEEGQKVEKMTEGISHNGGSVSFNQQPPSVSQYENTWDPSAENKARRK
jgi:hypothetical protein